MNTELLEKYKANLAQGASGQYVRWAQAFLETDPTLDRAGIDRWLKKLGKKYSPGTIAFAFAIVRSVFRANSLEWPYRFGEAPRVGERDQFRPTLHPDVIRQMIEAVKANHVPAEAAAYLALSTVYGLRREEMVQLTREDFDRDAGLFYVTTAKSGRERYHLIPEEIRDVLFRYDYGRHSLVICNQDFWVIITAAGLAALKSERLGWHSIRRSLNLGLGRNGCPELLLNRFMRWRAGGMSQRYVGNVEIGLEGRQAVSTETGQDAEVFEKYHPFLRFWREGVGE